MGGQDGGRKGARVAGFLMESRLIRPPGTYPDIRTAPRQPPGMQGESVSDTRAVFLSFACLRYEREVGPPSLPPLPLPGWALALRSSVIGSICG